MRRTSPQNRCDTVIPRMSAIVTGWLSSRRTAATALGRPTGEAQHADRHKHHSDQPPSVTALGVRWVHHGGLLLSSSRIGQPGQVSDLRDFAAPPHGRECVCPPRMSAAPSPSLNLLTLNGSAFSGAERAVETAVGVQLLSSRSGSIFNLAAIRSTDFSVRLRSPRSTPPR